MYSVSLKEEDVHAMFGIKVQLKLFLSPQRDNDVDAHTYTHTHTHNTSQHVHHLTFIYQRDT